MPSSLNSGNSFQLLSAEGGMQEMAAALRRAYPEPGKAPEDVQALLDKADKEKGRLGLKNIQQAAKHLDRPKKQLKDVNDQWSAECTLCSLAQARHGGHSGLGTSTRGVSTPPLRWEGSDRDLDNKQSHPDVGRRRHWITNAIYPCTRSY